LNVTDDAAEKTRIEKKITATKAKLSAKTGTLVF